MSNSAKILMIDNYDSFTFNLVHAIEEILDDTIDVVRNDEINFDQLSNYDKIILSPGPGIPDEAGDLKKLIDHCKESHKILGVCLGQQAISEVFGGSLTNLDKVFHGVATEMTLTDNKSIIFDGLTPKFEAGRYHSWVVNKATLPNCLAITCTDDFGEIMAIEHKELPIYAVQFHPESILTPDGPKMLANFILKA